MPNSEIPLDCEDWSIVFQVYRDHPQLSIDMAQHLRILKQYLQSEPNSLPEWSLPLIALSMRYTSTLHLKSWGVICSAAWSKVS